MRILGWAIFGFAVNLAMSQPATVTLKAKIRDFKENTATDLTGHPDFENDPFMGCGGENLGYVKKTIGLNGMVDTNLFKDDNREPLLQTLNHPSSGHPCFTSIEKFNDWYNDNPASNRSFYMDVVLTRNAQGAYSFINDKFFPLNPGEPWKKFNPTDPDPFPAITKNNITNVYGFTLELHSVFTYTAGKGQTFSFSGDDDVWVYINNQLVIDLGGLHHQWSSTVNLDEKAAALGLENGKNYPLDFFFAERHSTESHCQITTSLQLSQQEPVTIPVANPPGQEFQKSIQVGLDVPGTPGATIRYTTDGSEPTETSPIYTGPFVFTTTTTVKAKAFLGDLLPSPTMTEVYTWKPSNLAQPIANPPGQFFEQNIQVTFTVPGNPEAKMHYTLDGSEPTEFSPILTGPLSLDTTKTVKVKAFQDKWVPSPTTTEVYTWVPSILPKPVANPPSKSFLDSLVVSLSVPGHAGALIHYTLDGSEPTVASPIYSQPIRLTATAQIKAIAAQPKWQTSATLVENYVFTLPPNVIELKMERPVNRTKVSEVMGSATNWKQPIAIVLVDGDKPICLSCPPGTEDFLLKANGFPEWVTTTRDPFHYSFRIFDNLGHYIKKQSGEVTQAMLDLAPLADKKGYRILRFRWIPIADNGQVIGTGAYILHAKVTSKSESKPVVISKSDIFQRFGFVREEQ